MPNSPHLPGDRFFARLRTLDIECPACGEVYVLRPRKILKHRPTARTTAAARRQHKPLPRQHLIWDEVLQLFQCSTCSATYALGTVAWPIRPGSRVRPPEDTIPSPRQANAIRQQGGGFYLKTRTGANDPRNVRITQACSCEPDSRTPNPACPIHGPAGANLPAIAPPRRLGSLPHFRKPGIDYDPTD